MVAIRNSSFLVNVRWSGALRLPALVSGFIQAMKTQLQDES